MFSGKLHFNCIKDQPKVSSKNHSKNYLAKIPRKIYITVWGGMGDDGGGG